MAHDLTTDEVTHC